MFDYHVHSEFSADCETPMENSVKKAYELKLKEICFTDHIDYDYPDSSITFDLDLAGYDRAVRRLKEKYADRISVKKGVEIGIQPHLLDRYEQLMKKETFDFVICSMHTAEKKDLHSGSYFKGKTLEQAYENYYKELLFCVENYRQYSILGHIDLVKRYTKEQPEDACLDIIAEIFHVIIPQGKGIELNTSGVRYGMESGLPSTDILKLYRELGGEIITLGSDSHQAETLAFQFDQSIALLKDIGFRYIASYTNGKPVFHKI